MSILSDRQIAALSLQPTHIYDRPGLPKQFFFQRSDGKFTSTEDIETQTLYINRHFDRGIEHFVREIEVNDLADHRVPMLHPFVPHQVKTQPRYIHPDLPTWEADRVIAKAQRGYDPDFDGDTVSERIISYGLSSYGYDVRLGSKFKIFTNINSTVIDPMAMSDECYVDFEGDVCIIPPHSYALGHTVEYFRMPKDVVAVCLGKSTYARAGCAINVTPIEPGFEGQVVIEIANQTPLPMKVYANMGIAQFMFHRGERCMVSYADRAGKYQGQMGVTPARV